MTSKHPSYWTRFRVEIDNPTATAHGYGIVVSVSGSHSLSFLIRTHFVLVGVNNHRQFVIFVTTLVLGICLFDYLSYACGSSPPAILRASSHITCHRLLSGLGII